MSQLNRQARRVRTMVEEMAALINAGDPRWRKVLAKAQQQAAEITDPYSADDATSRLALVAHHERLLAGDFDGARAWLHRALAAIGRQRGRSDEQQRLDDHEWTVHLNLCQLEQLTGDWEAAHASARTAVELAPATVNPDKSHRHSLVTLAALDLARQRFPEAIAGYQQAVELFRAAEPSELGVVLLGLAQAQMQSGALAAAEGNLDRAEPLLAGNPEGLAGLQQARAFIAMVSRSPGAAEEMRAFAAQVGEGTEFNPIHRQQARQADAHAEHVDGDPVEAKQRFDRVVARARAEGDPVGLADALIRSSAATQDLALVTTDPETATGLHRAALAQATEAREIIAARERPLKLASIDVALADYVGQWHQVVDGISLPVLRAALTRADAAAAELRAAALRGDTAAARRDFAALHAGHGFEVACDLAFRLGDKETLARLINDRAAGYDWRAARVTGEQHDTGREPSTV
ncbi:hypothetical protein [Enemella sp. A6]|uniref:hypothetical protein n=1 Tax=Enemella sp. A6 TaxID=3440152 RepID=UPI003EBAED84